MVFNLPNLREMIQIYSCISNAYLFKVSISHILDCYNLILTGHFLENEGGGGNDEL